MNWDAVGAIGEIVSAIAVFATLLFLAVQIRQSNRVNAENTRISIAEMKRRSNDSITRWCESLLSDPELAIVWHRGNSGDTLSDVDRSCFYRLSRNYFGLHATSYYDYEAVRDARSQSRMIEFTVQEIITNRGLKAVWVSLENTPFNNYSEFCEGVNKGLSELRTDDAS